MKKLLLLIFAIVLVACGDNGISPCGSSSFVRPVVDTADTNEVKAAAYYTVEIITPGNTDMSTEEYITNPINFYVNEVNNSRFIVTHIYKCFPAKKANDILRQYNFNIEELHNRYLNYGATIEWQYNHDDVIIVYYEKCYDGTGRYM